MSGDLADEETGVTGEQSTVDQRPADRGTEVHDVSRDLGLRTGFRRHIEENQAAHERAIPARELVAQARRAQRAGFESLSISDHFHPWKEAQRQSPFVWAVIGALAESVPELPVASLVTCPIIRMHPVVLAQAAATVTVMLDGRFVFGVGTGENLNEHVTGAPWPPAKERLDRLREAVELIRRLWDGGNVDFQGR